MSRRPSSTPGPRRMPKDDDRIDAMASPSSSPPDTSPITRDDERHLNGEESGAKTATENAIGDGMRAYRACLNCRNRKSKCDLSVSGGRPPCRRCKREDRECVLGESHRGGRRVRKKPKLDNDLPGIHPSVQAFPSTASIDSHYMTRQSQGSPSTSQTFHNRYDIRQENGYAWQSHPNEQGSLTGSSQYQQGDAGGKNGEDGGVVPETIASADLQNPSDALDILAQVADRAEDTESPKIELIQGNGNQPSQLKLAPRLQSQSAQMAADFSNYKPVVEGRISPETIYNLFSNYERFFHPYFPIIPRETFNRDRLSWLSRSEPHLFSAILTIASKDNELVHQVCYDHMQQLVSMVVSGADAGVDAVEALLLLSQWVSHRPQASISVGRGEEDRVAWMYIGTALRLGYFLGIDRTSFRPDSHEEPATFNRKRLVWTACYVCDRQVSVRLGKGFWSRGPGPLSGLRSNDFPTLQPLAPGEDNFALIFQANLELTQIFSNVHDILYSSKSHGWKEMLDGRYTKYLDDFRISIRSWNDVWGTLICSSRLKASLLLTYDYLRLYVNAFAYQATMSRTLTYQRDSQHIGSRPLPIINASASDARFLYEALDAAKSLLSTFNNFVEPETLRYMPSSYYLFIIYSAVFLYKARSTTSMTDDERTGVRYMINQTIERLQKASVGANHMGSRYARLLQLLWRKPPSRIPKTSERPRQQNIDSRLETSSSQYGNGQPSNYATISTNYSDANLSGNTNKNPEGGEFSTTAIPPNTFSWLDLGATWNFATQNNAMSGSSAEPDELLIDVGPNPFLTDYSLLEGDNPNFIF